MSIRKVNIFANSDDYSQEVRKLLRRKLQRSGFTVPKEFDPESELIVSIGGDGALLGTLHKYDFPDIPILGINTGHLGFFQEIHPDELDEFVFLYKQSRYNIQRLKTVKAIVYDEDKQFEYKGLNEIVIKADSSISVHLNISIGDSFIERFSGDGILVCTPAGSTAYNYSLGGSIVDPRLSILQITPIAPMNTTAYRSFTSSVVLPENLSVTVHPESREGSGFLIVTDGMEFSHSNISKMVFGFSKTEVSFMRFENYDFWTKVKTKFL
ncbi:MAG TPA: NAD(+)/NADH kinase [Anaerovoracaceae bacterium]|nr:NAD(+)/NADH kinase [Anaerovoracaceae bacterium]